MKNIISVIIIVIGLVVLVSGYIYLDEKRVIKIEKNQDISVQCIQSYTKLEQKYQNATGFFNDDEEEISVIKSEILILLNNKKCTNMRSELTMLKEKCDGVIR